MLDALAANPTASFTDLSRPAREALSSAHPDAAITYLISWRTNTDPLAAAVDPLIDFGAAAHSRGRVTITPLGHWALETLQARAPRPISTDLTATELLTRLTQIDEDEQSYAAQPWLARRAPLPASRDLLAAAATATPAQRLAAVELVHALGPRADAAWGEAAALPNLAAHVRLARDDLDEPAADWLAVEYAAAALPDHGPDEALARLDDRFPGIGRDFQPQVIERTTHPAAAELTAAVTTFLASGTTPTSAQAYQLKISLDRMRPPVWRRVLLPATATLAELHEVIQVAMEWDENHLHAFTVGRRNYGDLNFAGDYHDEEQLRLTRAFASSSTISYRYDFGDCWDHSIHREHVLDLLDGATYPACVAGRGDASTARAAEQSRPGQLVRRPRPHAAPNRRRRSAAPTPPRAARRRRCSPKSSHTASSSGIGGLGRPATMIRISAGGRAGSRPAMLCALGAGRDAAVPRAVPTPRLPPLVRQRPPTPRPGHRTREPHLYMIDNDPRWGSTQRLKSAERE